MNLTKKTIAKIEPKKVPFQAPLLTLNLIVFLGPMFHPELHGSLSMFRAILKGEKLKNIPNNSMSFIDVRDLAQLELAALENNNARGMV
mgnify:CR=1 FL=1